MYRIKFWIGNVISKELIYRAKYRINLDRNKKELRQNMYVRNKVSADVCECFERVYFRAKWSLSVLYVYYNMFQI